MIPILYPREENEFQTEGFGRLTDIISCVVTEERNGVYEVEFQYPITGTHYDEIIEGRIISCTHDENGDRQPFVIYRRSAPINGIVTFNARHISYELSGIVVAPFTASNIEYALSGLKTYSMIENRFLFFTDKAVITKQFKVPKPMSCRELLGGTEGSILDTYGTGEWKFDNFTCYLYLHRGSDSGVTIRYGKNLIDLTHEVETGEIYDAIVPYWYSEETNTLVQGGVVLGDTIIMQNAYLTTDLRERITNENGLPLEVQYPDIRAIPMDFTDEFENAPTKAQLEAKAYDYLNDNEPWKPNENIVVDFVNLWQTEEYADYAQLQSVKLCDTVTVDYAALGVHSVKMKVVRVTWNCLLERYDEIELGTPSVSFGDLILGETYGKIDSVMSGYATATDIQVAIQNATDHITGQSGGYLIFHYDADGRPTEMLIMDSPSELTATHIWRYNAAGWGHSSDGGATYSLAATLDGGFVADFITAGVLNANLIKAGMIQGNGDNNYWNLVNGTLSVQKGYVGGMTLANNKLTYGDFTDLTVNSMQLDVTGLICDYATTLGDDNVAVRTELSDAATGVSWSLREYSGNNIVTKKRADMGLGGGADIGVSVPGVLEINTYDSENSNRHMMLTFEPLYHSNPNKITIGRSNDKVAMRGYCGLIEIDANAMKFTASNYFYLYGFIDMMNGVEIHGALQVDNNLTVSGTKSRSVKTSDYGTKLLYAYETASPMFGDVGEGVIGEGGVCYVWLDPIFSETIQTTQYQVFLQAYGEGSCFVSERHPGYFVVRGTEGMAFGWELKAKQVDFTQDRLMSYYKPEPEEEKPDYAQMAQDHISEIYRERGIGNA